MSEERRPVTKKLTKPEGRYLAESWNLLPTEAKERNGSVDYKIGGLSSANQ